MKDLNGVLEGRGGEGGLEGGGRFFEEKMEVVFEFEGLELEVDWGDGVGRSGGEVL